MFRPQAFIKKIKLKLKLINLNVISLSFIFLIKACDRNVKCQQIDTVYTTFPLEYYNRLNN